MTPSLNHCPSLIVGLFVAITVKQVFNNVVEDPYKDTGDADTIALTGEENLNFPKMRDWILEFISERSESRYTLNHQTTMAVE